MQGLIGTVSPDVVFLHVSGQSEPGGGGGVVQSPYDESLAA